MGRKESNQTKQTKCRTAGEKDAGPHCPAGFTMPYAHVHGLLAINEFYDTWVAFDKVFYSPRVKKRSQFYLATSKNSPY